MFGFKRIIGQKYQHLVADMAYFSFLRKEAVYPSVVTSQKVALLIIHTDFW
jgi:hypothetical protein